MTAHESPALSLQPLPAFGGFNPTLNPPAAGKPSILNSMSSSLRLSSSFLLAAAFALVLLSAARAADDSVTTIKFSDPAKPGTLKIVLAHGDLHIKGDDSAEISVKSDVKPVTHKPRKDGLREIAAASSYNLREKDNVVTLDALPDGGWPGTPSDFRITVPRATTVVVASSLGGDITCTGVSGDLEIKCMSGEIKLEDITGSALVETMNGEIHASVRELHDGKPLSFTSMNGEVVLRVPADAKANVRLRTQNGSILTDFDDTALVTKTESTPRSSSHRTTHAIVSNGNNSVIPAEARDAIREAVRASAAAIRDAAQVARDAAQAAREGARDDSDSTAPMPPIPPMPPLPAMTGGKLVTGTLHGGGPEISVTTMNGDVTLRQLDAKK